MRSKYIEKRIDYVQTALKADEKKNPNRPLNEFAELINLIVDQFDDKYNYKPKGL